MSDVGNPIIDVVFGVRMAHGQGGAYLPADHGYALFSAISRLLPWIHGNRAVGIQPLSGRPGGQRSWLLSRHPHLALRVPASLVPALLPLAGASLDINGALLHIGTPHIRLLRPAAQVRSRLVVIKGAQTPDQFLNRTQAELAALGVQGAVQLVRRRSSQPVEAGGRGGQEMWVRRTVQVRDKLIVGYALEVHGLSEPDSIRLQGAGLGGRRRFGCGIFTPVGGHSR